MKASQRIVSLASLSFSFFFHFFLSLSVSECVFLFFIFFSFFYFFFSLLDTVAMFGCYSIQCILSMQRNWSYFTHDSISKPIIRFGVIFQNVVYAWCLHIHFNSKLYSYCGNFPSNFIIITQSLSFYLKHQKYQKCAVQSESKVHVAAVIAAEVA